MLERQSIYPSSGVATGARSQFYPRFRQLARLTQGPARFSPPIWHFYPDQAIIKSVSSFVRWKQVAMNESSSSIAQSILELVRRSVPRYGIR
jgi:hypothetical protein